MSGISGNSPFDIQLQKLTRLLQKATPSFKEQREIKELSLFVVAYLRNHPEEKESRQVQALHKQIQFFEECESSSTQGKTDRVVSDQLGIRISNLTKPSFAPTSAKLLFNLLGDEFGSNSQLEGINHIEVLTYVTEFIKQQRSLDTSFLDRNASLLSELEMACRIEKEGLLKILHEGLSDNKPFIIPGGWIGTPVGHCVYYEVFPQEDDTVNFRIFNTGEGIQEHLKVQVGVKKKVAFLEWRGIPKENLLHPHFAQIIKETKTQIYYPNVTNPSYPKYTDYKAADIYKSLKTFLKPTSVVDGLEAPLMEPQRAGTCSCRALFALLKSKLHIDDYRRLKLDLRIQALSNFISQPPEDDLSPKVQYHLIDKATEKLSRRVHDLFAKKAIESKTLIAAQKQLANADLWLRGHRTSKPILAMDENFTKPMHLLARDKAPPIVTLLALGKETPAAETRLSHLMSQISTYSLDNPEIFTESIQHVSCILKAAYENKEFTAVHFAILDIVRKIPIDPAFWAAIKRTKPEIETAINYVGDLSELFFKSCYRIQDSRILFNEKKYALTKLLFTQNKLAEFLEVRNCNLINNTDIAITTTMRNKDSILYTQELDPVTDNEMRQIKSLEVPYDKSFFGFAYSKKANSQSSMMFFIADNPPFIKLIKDKYPEVLIRIKKENPNFDTLPSAKQRELIFVSPHLPSWIESIKKSLLCTYYIQVVPIPPLPDPRISLDFQYQNISEYLCVSLQGISGRNFNHDCATLDLLDTKSSKQAPIQNPNIQHLIEEVPSLTEKSFLTFNLKHWVPLTTDINNELEHIFTNPHHSPVEALEYFTRNPEKLSNLDYQQLFQMACFNVRSSDRIRSFKDQIALFLRNQISFSQNQEDIKAQVFLQRMGRYFRRYECAAPDETRYLLQLLDHKKTTPEEKSLIYAELAASLSEFSSLNNTQATFLLKAKAWIEHTPIPLEWKDPQTSYDFEKALCKHSLALMNVLFLDGSPNTSLLNEIYTLINEKSPPSDLTWESAYSFGMSPRFTSNHNDFYDPMSGRLMTIGQQVYLPLEMRNHFYFKELFPDQLKGIARSSDTYEFMHKGAHVVINKTEEGLRIEQYIGGEWLRFIPSTKLTSEVKETVISTLESRYLVDKYNVWHSISNPTMIYLYDKKTNTNTHWIDHNFDQISVIHRHSDKAILSKSSQLFANIEHPSYIQEWYLGDKRIEIELPRFNLSFKPDKEGRLQCAQHPGFFLNEDQNLSAIDPCKYALILKNAEGQIRVILPNQLLEKPKINESLEPTFKRDQSLKIGESADFTYFTYDLTSNGYLASSSREGYFYLAQTLAVHHEYKKAAHYLRIYGEKLSAYSPSEIEALKEIAKVKEVTGDQSGEQVAIALYATYLLTTNKICSADALRALPGLYEQYLLRSRNVTALRLSKEEELHLLRSLLPEPLSAAFKFRIRQLDATILEQPDPIYTQDIGRTTPTKNSEVDLGQLTNLMSNRTALLPLNFEKSVLITRSGDFIKMHLVEIIKLALQGSYDQKRWIHTACLFLKENTQNPTNAFLGFIIEKILQRPDQFTIPPQQRSRLEDQPLNLDEWWIKTIDIAESLGSIPTQSATRTTHPFTHRAPTYPLAQPAVDIPYLDLKFTPQVSAPLSEDRTISTLTTRATQPVSVNTQLTAFLASQKSDDPVESAEWTRLQEDATALSKKPSKTIYHLAKEISKITPILQAKKEEIQKNLTILEDQMILIVSKQPKELTGLALFDVQKRGRLLQEITLDDIFMSLALKDPQKLLEQNPYLNKMELNTLYLQASNYLQLASQKTQLDRCLTLCAQISTNPIEGLKLELGELLNAKRCYDISKNPEYLVFEYYAGIIMREDQVGKLASFIQGERSNPIMEMIMGSGKSKVLLPLLGLLRADGQALSMVIVPAPLFESVSSDTQEILQKAFTKSLKTLHFDRNSTFTKRSLEEIKTFLETVITKHQCLIMTSKSIQSLMLKFIEYANSVKDGTDPENEELKSMTQIISLLKKAGNPLIDEADTVLNILHEVSFSLGQKVPVKEEEIHLIGMIYQLLYSDPTLKRIARLESDPYPNMSTDVPPLSESLYHGSLKKPLAIALIAKLIEQEKLPSNINQSAVLNYLCRDPVEGLAEFFAAQSPEIQNLLALGAEELSSLLPHTLLKTSDERYGLDNGVIAIPYAAANTPSHGSLFSNPHITMNYTYQIHTKNGIGEDTLIYVIQQFKKQADRQMYDEGISLEDTLCYKQFCLLKGELPIPFKHNLHPDDLKSLTERINRDANIQLQLIEQLLLPQMEIFEKKLACNPINLIAFFSKASGFTGTLWNARSMHSKLQPEAEAGTDAKTLNLLMEKCLRPALVIPKVSGMAMLPQIPHYDALIDAGGYFKEGGNLEIARKMAVVMKKPVVFYNSQGVQTITDGTAETPLSTSPLKEDQRFTFYDQCHTTGSDIKQKAEAIGLVTIGRGMILRDLLQSVWRLRGLEKGQTVQFVIDEEVASIIKAQLHLEEAAEIDVTVILRFVIKNQANQQGNDNFKAYKQQLDNLSQNLLLEVMTNPDYTPEQKTKAFSYLSTTWIKPANQSPAELYGKPAFERPSHEVILEAAAKCLTQLNEIGKQFPFLDKKIDVLKDEIPQLQARATGSIPPQVISQQSDTDGTVEVEQASQVETEASTSMETEGDNQFKFMQLGIVTADTWTQVKALVSQSSFDTIPVFPIGDQMSREPELRSYQDLFDGIDISINVLEWENMKHEEIDKMRLLGHSRIPFHHLIIKEDTVILFSQYEKITEDPNYYNLTLGFKDPSRELSPAAFKKVVKLKFLNGESSFTKKELAFLETWFKEAGVAQMQDLYLKHILKYQTNKKVAFKGSALEALFKQLKTQTQ